MSTGGIFLAILLVLMGIWQAGAGFFGAIAHFFTPSVTPPQVNIPTLIVNQVREVSELTTAIFVMEAVVPTQQDRKMGDLTIGTTKLLYVAQGEVRAGVDLDELEAKNVRVSQDKVQILLPPPEILDSKIDVSRSGVYHYDRGFLGLGPDVAPELQTLAQRQTLDKIVTTACDQGVLQQANDKAELTIEKLLTTAGYEKVEVKTTPPAKDACIVAS